MTQNKNLSHQNLFSTRLLVLLVKFMQNNYFNIKLNQNYQISWFPGVQGLNVDDPSNVELRSESWKVLEDFHEQGLLRSIGVSNYNVRHLQDLLARCRIKPHVNQVWRESYKINLVLKKSLLVLNSLTIHYIDFDKTSLML